MEETKQNYDAGSWDRSVKKHVGAWSKKNIKLGAARECVVLDYLRLNGAIWEVTRCTKEGSHKNCLEGPGTTTSDRFLGGDGESVRGKPTT